MDLNLFVKLSGKNIEGKYKAEDIYYQQTKEIVEYFKDTLAILHKSVIEDDKEKPRLPEPYYTSNESLILATFKGLALSANKYYLNLLEQTKDKSE